jgi:hypothetical protein
VLAQGVSQSDVLLRRFEVADPEVVESLRESFVDEGETASRK